MKELINNYKINLSKTLENLEIEKVKELCELILSIWKSNNTIYMWEWWQCSKRDTYC